ncbi:hypothetical protein GCM10027598_59480 [Amycolatopsis oliviviridis]|uniref:Uncharacterized protein n=1 Tax=Amycolatopsis oliviviridis TaxID=1471590 RepID=A0ABQ3M7E1_9PSEU|nr:hypothetical protein GCM10017790_60130 [Amycolatopsis oliviviridis]
MWAHFLAEQAEGRTPTGADLDRVAGTHNYGRRILRKWRDEGLLQNTTPGNPPLSRPMTAAGSPVTQPRSQQAAGESCTRDGERGENCCAYHGDEFQPTEPGGAAVWSAPIRPALPAPYPLLNPANIRSRHLQGSCPQFIRE